MVDVWRTLEAHGSDPVAPRALPVDKTFDGGQRNDYVCFTVEVELWAAGLVPVKGGGDRTKLLFHIRDSERHVEDEPQSRNQQPLESVQFHLHHSNHSHGPSAAGGKNAAAIAAVATAAAVAAAVDTTSAAGGACSADYALLLLLLLLLLFLSQPGPKQQLLLVPILLALVQHTQLLLQQPLLLLHPVVVCMLIVRVIFVSTRKAARGRRDGKRGEEGALLGVTILESSVGS